MGRSGTSAATRALVASGFYAGADSELMEANATNPAGFWENLALLRINEEILSGTGGTWFTPPTSEAQLAARQWAEPKLRTVLRELLAEAGGAPVAIKDPRIGVLSKLWGPVIDASLHPVLVVRNPVEIALSLATRDGTPTAFGLASWELHMAGLLEYLNGRAVTVARYVELVRSREAVMTFVGDVAGRLTPECVARVDVAAAPNAIQPELYHNRAAFSDLSAHLTGRQADLWQFLDGLSPGIQVLGAPWAFTRRSEAAVRVTRCELDRVGQLQYADRLQAQVAGHKRALTEHRLRAIYAEHERDAAVRSLALERERADEAGRTRGLAGDARARAEQWLRAIEGPDGWRRPASLRTALRAVRRVGATFLRST